MLKIDCWVSKNVLQSECLPLWFKVHSFHIVFVNNSRSACEIISTPAVYHLIVHSTYRTLKLVNKVRTFAKDASLTKNFHSVKTTMSESRYERITQANVDNESNEPNLDINSNDNTRDDTAIEMPNQNMLNGFAHTAISTLGLILVYFTLSIGLTFYQRNFLKVRMIRSNSCSKWC